MRTFTLIAIAISLAGISARITSRPNHHSSNLFSNSSKPHSNHQKSTDLEKARVCLDECVTSCSEESKLADLGSGCFASCYKKCASHASEGSDEKNNAEFLNSIETLPQNHCLNRKNPAQLTPRQALLEFAAGPCSPLMLVPGLAGTKLTIEIDCDTLQKSHPTAFSQCGWNACKKSFYEFWKKVPDPEYVLWVPEAGSPLSVLSSSKAANLCFAQLVSFDVQFNVPIEQMVKLKDGVKVKVFGFTEKTKDKGECGTGAIINLLPNTQNVLSGNFSALMIALKRIGYVSGLTMQAMPYNFFYSYQYNEFRINLYRNLIRLRRITGKKVTIVGHGYGNINILFNLSFLSQSEKDQLIFNWVAIAPPFSGSYESQFGLTIGTDLPYTFLDEGKFNFIAARKVNSKILALFDMAIQNPFALYAGEPWLEKVKQRIDYEKQYPKVKYEDSGISFWPPKSNECYEESLKDLKPNCSININDVTRLEMMRVLSKQYTISDSMDLINNFALEEDSKRLFRKLSLDPLPSKSPGVPLIVVFMSALGTIADVEANQETLDDIKNNNYPHLGSFRLTPGDGWTPSFSSLMLPFKWALEYDADNQTGKPVKFIEYCGVNSRLNEVYDWTDPRDAFEIRKNSYNSISCQCLGKQKSVYYDCNHQRMISDVDVVDTVGKVLNGNQKVSSEDLNYINGLKDIELYRDMKFCQHIVPNAF